MSVIKVKLVKSSIGKTKRQVDTLKALRLNKINRISEFKKTPQILGMIRKVNHLVEVIE